MGEESVSNSSPTDGARSDDIPCLYAYFDKIFPTYLLMGMSYEEFWDGDAELPKFYRECYKLKQKKENELAWLQGMYTYVAMTTVMQNVFGKGEKKNYLTEPISLDGVTEEEKIKKQNKNDEQAKAYMEMFAMRFNQKFKEKGGE